MLRSGATGTAGIRATINRNEIARYSLLTDPNNLRLWCATLSIPDVHASKVATALRFFGRARLSPLDAYDHMRGIDWSRPVTSDEQKPLRVGERFSSARFKGGDLYGQYYAKLGAPKERSGINSDGRILRNYTVTGAKAYLRSVAAPMKDTFTENRTGAPSSFDPRSMKYGVMALGGNEQIMIIDAFEALRCDMP